MAATLPLTVEEVTAAWLGQALATGGADVAVERAETVGVVWGTATKVLLEVTYSAGGDGYPSRLCVKGGFVPELRAIMGPDYQAEARFYRDVAPRLGPEVPACYFAAVDEASGQGVVVLEDLIASGAAFCDPRQVLAPETVAAGLELLARWHARKDLDDARLAGSPHFRPMVRGLLTSEHWDTHIGQTTAGPVLEVLADRTQILRAFEALWAGEDARPPTFVHGDANLTNVYLDATGAPRFADWQFVCRGDPYHDVALFLIGSLSVEDRRDHEESLLRGYLSARGEKAEPFAAAWEAYRRHPLHGAMYALTPEAMQPADVRAALADRFAQAAVDLETLRALTTPA